MPIESAVGTAAAGVNGRNGFGVGVGVGVGNGNGAEVEAVVAIRLL